jgi:hypothetical protein
MVVGKVELTSLVEVALKANLWRFSRVNDRMVRAARLIVRTARTMTRFAAYFMGVRARSLQSSVGCRFEVAINLSMAFGTTG